MVRGGGPSRRSATLAPIGDVGSERVKSDFLTKSDTMTAKPITPPPPQKKKKKKKKHTHTHKRKRGH